MTTLADIVRATLSGAEARLKVASARDSAPAAGEDLDFLADLKLSSDDKPPPFQKKDKDEEEKDEKKEKTSSRAILDDAAHAKKLAQALTLGSNIVAAKLASRSHLDAPGPAVQEASSMGPAHLPKAHSKVTDRITGPSTQGPGGLSTNKADHTGQEPKKASWTKDRAATTAVLRAKMAQAEELIEAGQHGAARALLGEVEKISQRLQTDPPVSSHVPDNRALVNLTKAQARDTTTREATRFFSEPPKKDPMVAATQLRSDGLKLSSVKPQTKKASVDFDPEVGRAYLSKIIKTASDPDASAQERQKAASALQKIKDRLEVDPETFLG